MGMTGRADLDVLIVDDHEAMRTLLTRVLQKAGVERVRTAAGGGEALAALRERPASLVLADQNMPGMDGLALLAAVRGDTALSAVRFIMISGHASAEYATQARAAGADAMLVKPVSVRDLLATINGLFAV
jgi:CheY-like chemotaxis protein